MKAYCHTKVVMKVTNKIEFIEGNIYDFEIDELSEVKFQNESKGDHWFGSFENINGGKYANMFHDHFYDVTKQEKRRKTIKELIERG